MSKAPITISVDDDHLSRLPAVVAALRAKGVTVDQVLETAGVIVGSVDTADLAGLTDIEGVAFVEPERTFQIAPPESEVQ